MLHLCPKKPPLIKFLFFPSPLVNAILSLQLCTRLFFKLLASFFFVYSLSVFAVAVALDCIHWNEPRRTFYNIRALPHRPNDVFELHQVRQSPDLAALKLRIFRSGSKKETANFQLLQMVDHIRRLWKEKDGETHKRALVLLISLSRKPPITIRRWIAIDCFFCNSPSFKKYLHPTGRGGWYAQLLMTLLLMG